MYGAGSGDGFSRHKDHRPVTGNVPAGSDKGLLNTSRFLIELPQLPASKIAYQRSRAVANSSVCAPCAHCSKAQRESCKHVN